MRMWWGLGLVVAAFAVACSSDDTFECQTSQQCAGDGAVCQETGYCSFPDDDCESGQRYGDLAGGLAGQCVVDDASSSSGVVSTSAGTTGDETTSGSMTTAAVDDTSSSSSEAGSSDTSSTGAQPQCWVEEFEANLLGRTWTSWVDPGVSASMGSGTAEIELAEVAGYGGIRTDFTLDVSNKTATWTFDTLPDLEGDEVYEVLLTTGDTAVRVEIGFGALTGYWDNADSPPQQLFSQPAPGGDLEVVQLTERGGSLTLDVINDQGEVIEVVNFAPPPDWDASQQAVEFRAGALQADGLPGELVVESVSVCP